MIIAATLAFTIASTTFKANGPLPITTVAKDCGGQNISPELHWSNAPANAKSFALIVHDPDAPRPGGFYHWAVANIPGSAFALGSGTERYPGYYGPCPPPGKLHHYNITLYALDVAHLDIKMPLDALTLQSSIKGHVLGQATVTGTYEMNSTQ
jgi:phosphatidylethanolamine-binding protein (PEBP) family uncharacterized protein